MECRVALAFDGLLTLNATWLAEHHADLSPIQWAESIDSEIEFLGIESDAVALQSLNGALSLKSARYWFRQEGQEFTVKTDDTLLLKSGKWQLHSTSAHLVIEKATIETPAVGTFRYETALASGLSVTEALLPAENEPVLKITYAGKDLEVDVRTSYYDRTSSIPTKALCSASGRNLSSCLGWTTCNRSARDGAGQGTDLGGADPRFHSTRARQTVSSRYAE